jgi:hypothetical protein
VLGSASVKFKDERRTHHFLIGSASDELRLSRASSWTFFINV